MIVYIILSDKGSSNWLCYILGQSILFGKVNLINVVQKYLAGNLIWRFGRFTKALPNWIPPIFCHDVILRISGFHSSRTKNEQLISSKLIYSFVRNTATVHMDLFHCHLLTCWAILHLRSYSDVLRKAFHLQKYVRLLTACFPRARCYHTFNRTCDDAQPICPN